MLTFLFLGMIEISYMKCRPTTSDIYGPYYIPNSPQRKLFCRYKREKGYKGVPLYVYGRVLSCDCNTPLPRVKIEMWQANHVGEWCRRRL